MLQPSGAAKHSRPWVSSYIPWSAEKKKWVMMYLWIGLLLSLSKTDMSRFEYFHLRQALGRWLVFMLVVLVSVVLLFLPIIWFVGRLVIVAMLVMGWLFVKQAWDGVAYDIVENAQIPLFVGVGGWLLQMFDMTIRVPWDNLPEESEQNHTNT
jgi:uncharacterized membrane protein